MPSSLEWRRYYEENARSRLEIPWQLGPELTTHETAAIAQSLKEFQAGESSEGKYLFRCAQEYAQRTGDLEYVSAIRLFIAEEQRHARDLGRFLTVHRRSLTSEYLNRCRRLVPQRTHERIQFDRCLLTFRPTVVATSGLPTVQERDHFLGIVMAVVLELVGVFGFQQLAFGIEHDEHR
jgi:hypothetical protein